MRIYLNKALEVCKEGGAKAYIFLLLLLCVMIVARSHQNQKNTNFFIPSTTQKNFRSIEVVQSFTLAAPEHPFEHAVTLALQNNSQIRAVWYAGSCEACRDVGLYTAISDVHHPTIWSKPILLISPRFVGLAEKRYIHTLGNPVLFNSGKNLWLFFVSSFSGWSTSSLNYMTSQDNGQHWSKPTVFITAPLFNMSTLVKNSPFLYANGSIGLPAYYEIKKYTGLLLHLNVNGRILAASNIPAQGSGLQPIIIPITIHHAISLLRYHGKPPQRILLSTTQNNGKTWSIAQKSNLPNPDAAISAVAINPQQLLLVYNNQTEGRNLLALSLGAVDNSTMLAIKHRFSAIRYSHTSMYAALRFSKIDVFCHSLANCQQPLFNYKKQARDFFMQIKTGTPQQQFSYPYLISLPNNQFLLAYSFGNPQTNAIQALLLTGKN